MNTFKYLVSKILFKLIRYREINFLYEIIYFFRNPWNLNNYNETLRYKKINEYLLEFNNLNKFESAIEIGSGEGHQSIYLSQITKNLDAIEISSIASKRSKKRNLGNVNFKKINLYNYKSNKYYDVVIASEVIYYFNDIEKFINKIETLGNSYFISYYYYENDILKKYFIDSKYKKYVFEIDNSKWQFIYWVN